MGKFNCLFTIPRSYLGSEIYSQLCIFFSKIIEKYTKYEKTRGNLVISHLDI